MMIKKERKYNDMIYDEKKRKENKRKYDHI